MEYTDKELVCSECNTTFVFSAGEQEFYASRGLVNEPRRCPDCRRARKGQGYSGGGERTREMYPVVCANCGAETEVPFRPTGVRPVYCSDCFNKQRV